MIDRDQLSEALRLWSAGENYSAYSNRIKEAARLVVEGREVWWCENHDAFVKLGDVEDRRCVFGYGADRNTCRMVRMILIDGNTE